MIEEVGVVTKIEGAMAKVVVQKRGTCEGCAAQGACESTSEGMEIEALNMAKAKKGQAVKIAMKPQMYLKGTMLVYGIPLVLFITGAIIGKNIAEEYFKDMSSDLVAAITAFAVLFLSLFGIKVWAKKAESKTEYKPIIQEIVR